MRRTRFVDPSMSVKRKVTVPLGSGALLIASGSHHSNRHEGGCEGLTENRAQLRPNSQPKRRRRRRERMMGFDPPTFGMASKNAGNDSGRRTTR
jgi:hypothetical protein